MAVKTVIGLDIGSTAVRASETQRGKHGPGLASFAWAALPPGAVQAGTIQDDQAVVGALKHLWSTTKFRSRQVIIGFNHRQVVVRDLSVSNLPDKELRASLPFQVRQTLPLPVEQTLLDFHRLAEHGSGSTVRGLVIAAPKDAVLTMVHTVERAGLHVAGVDLASFALLRSTSRLDATVEALVDIGAASTTVVVHVDGEPLIVRTIPRGGREITESVAKRLEISPEDAETAKCDVGLGTGSPAPAAAAIGDAVRPLVNEIRSSFAYLTAAGQRTGVARLVLSGGGSLLSGLTELLTDHLGVEVVLADPIARVRGTTPRPALEALERSRAVAGVSIGLALGATR
ncbi:MAG: type IV pilus assembly protein PilM [Dactylosporangium sp.]|nr:type IV pilus assembly protein PilM [Dactylosporangium sp.]NNJ63186.1 type IV pilus assembly protein PilM [Dactylosporangium sp.]